MHLSCDFWGKDKAILENNNWRVKQILHGVNSLICTPQKKQSSSITFKSHNGSWSKYIRPGKQILGNKSGQIFCVRQVYFIKSCQQIWWRVTSLLFFLYITSQLRQCTMRRCFYHTGLRQNAFTVLHNFAIQIALIQYSERLKHAWAFSENVQKFPKSPIRPAGSYFWQASNFAVRAVKCLHINRIRFNIIKNLLCLNFNFYLMVL